MVRTSVRTITLKIYSIGNQKMRELFIGLPYCSYFAHLACQLRDSWVAIDKHVDSLTQDPRKIDLMLNDTEDANEALFYIQDIFATGDTNITRMLANALLHYAYLPFVVRSLCSMRQKPLLTLNTCIYVLTQTFRVITERRFIDTLFASLFVGHLPRKVVETITGENGNPPSPPSSYSQKYTSKHIKDYTLE